MDDRSKELCQNLADMTGMYVTATIHKGARRFEFMSGKQTVGTVYTYGKAKRFAKGIQVGREVERRLNRRLTDVC